MKQFSSTLVVLAASVGLSNAALVGTNLSFEDGGTINGATGWVATSTGSGSLGADDFRSSPDPNNWYPDSTAGTYVLIIESDDNTDDTGVFSQLLTGTGEAGTYTWSLRDVGVTNFADNSADGAFFTFGFSLDGSTFVGSASQNLSEGVEIFSPEQNATGQFNGSVSYISDGTEPAVYLMLESFNGVGNNTTNGRTAITVPSTTLGFAAVPEPSAAVLIGFAAAFLIFRRRK